jgi:hypothetical protein
MSNPVKVTWRDVSYPVAISRGIEFPREAEFSARSRGSLASTSQATIAKTGSRKHPVPAMQNRGVAIAAIARV